MDEPDTVTISDELAILGMLVSVQRVALNLCSAIKAQADGADRAQVNSLLSPAWDALRELNAQVDAHLEELKKRHE
jgi:hypothetical protein